MQRGRLYPQCVQRYACPDFQINRFAPLTMTLNWLGILGITPIEPPAQHSTGVSFDRDTCEFTWTFLPWTQGLWTYDQSIRLHAVDTPDQRFMELTLTRSGLVYKGQRPFTWSPAFGFFPDYLPPVYVGLLEVRNDDPDFTLFQAAFRGHAYY